LAYLNGVRTLGIRPIDAAIVAVAIAAVELNVAAGGGSGAAPLNWVAYLLGAVLPLPILFRRRWPFQVLLACTALMILFYILHRRNISPAPALAVPVYDATVAGYLAVSIAIPAFFMVVGWLVVELSKSESLTAEASDFLPQFAALALVIMLGEVVRARRALLRVTAEERAAEAARQVAEERLRIARELHDTVAHSMATITVQAGSALHVLNDQNGSGDRARPAAPASVAAALIGIRETSKSALSDMRAVLGQLRAGPGFDSRAAGLGRLPELREAVGAAGLVVSVTVAGTAVVLPAEADHAAYRILQESLTNVLRHAGPGATAAIFLRYEPGSLFLSVTDDGVTAPDLAGGGHGINGMLERAAAVGGTLAAGPADGGGFQVSATLPTGDTA
jgi:signal transduction histidine kinase